MNAVNRQSPRKEHHSWQYAWQRSTFNSPGWLGTRYWRQLGGCADEPARLAQQGPLCRPRPPLDRLRPHA